MNVLLPVFHILDSSQLFDSTHFQPMFFDMVIDHNSTFPISKFQNSKYQIWNYICHIWVLLALSTIKSINRLFTTIFTLTFTAIFDASSVSISRGSVAISVVVIAKPKSPILASSRFLDRKIFRAAMSRWMIWFCFKYNNPDPICLLYEINFELGRYWRPWVFRASNNDPP